MMNLEVKLEDLKNDYPDFYNFFKDALANSQSRFKNYKEEKYKCFYYVGFFMKPSQKTEEYCETLSNMKWEERVIEEYKKTRVTITMISGKFALSDQTIEICDTIKPFLDEIISRKMYFEQMSNEDGPNEEVLESIPDLEELKLKIEEEKEAQKDFLESMGLKLGMNVSSDKKELTPQDMLNKLIDDEKYEEAEELIKKHPELKKRDGDE